MKNSNKNMNNLLLQKNKRKSHRDIISRFANNCYWLSVFGLDAEYEDYLQKEYDVTVDDFLQKDKNGKIIC